VLDPFVGLRERLNAAVTLEESERSWLIHQLATARESYDQVKGSRERARVLHGDAHGGNIVATTDGEVVLLDFERVAIGPPEWDLVSIAVENDSVTLCTDADYAELVDEYGEDVKNWPHYEMFRSIRELRMTCYIAELANDHPAARDEARFRVECLRGEHGERPWPWTPM